MQGLREGHSKLGTGRERHRKRLVDRYHSGSQGLQHVAEPFFTDIASY
jgi:hypothetical protein